MCGRPIMQEWWPPLVVDALVIDERWRAAVALNRSSAAAEVHVRQMSRCLGQSEGKRLVDRRKIVRPSA